MTTGAATVVGNVASPLRTFVDASGTVSWDRDRSWSLEWWIGAEDRWHIPANESAVRQRLVDGTPVVETAMRVPGGDAVQRVYGTRDGDDEYLVVEIHNQSRVPFAVAFAIRDAPGAIQLSEDGVQIRRTLALLLPGRPRFAASGRHVAEQVVGGTATAPPARFPGRPRDAAFLFPLAHTAVLRAAVPLTHPPRRAPANRPHPPANRLPSAADAVRGWQTQTRRGLRLELPAGRLAEAVEANRRHLLLLHQGDCPGSPAIAIALARYGFIDESAEMVRSSFKADVAWLASLAEYWRLTGDVDLVRSMVAPVAAVAGRRTRSRQVWIDGAELLAAAGEHKAAEALAQRARQARPLSPEADEAGLTEQLDKMLDNASPTWTWTDREGVTAQFCSLVRNLLVRDGPNGLSICNEMPPAWSGQPIEVHDAPTHAGRLSFAVRWHGSRPALLWELQPRDPARPVRITAPGLDPQWVSEHARGDALLGAVQESFQ